MRLSSWKLHAAAAAALALPLGACAQSPPSPPSGQSAQASSILAGSTPANGATVAAPVNRLELRFDPPARLGEVTVTGPDGMMPMMVTAVGEVARYELPLSGLGPGAYRVEWKASIAGTGHQGSFAFTVR